MPVQEWPVEGLPADVLGAGPRADVPRVPSDDADSLKACCSAALWPYPRPPSASLLCRRESSLPSARRLESVFPCRRAQKACFHILCGQQSRGYNDG